MLKEVVVQDLTELIKMLNLVHANSQPDLLCGNIKVITWSYA
jgi:hypothetical protein